MRVRFSSRGMIVRAQASVIIGLAVVTGTLELARAQVATDGRRPARRRLWRRTYDPTNPRGPYLGQRPPGMIPKVFAPGFISTTADEYAIAFTPDGTEIYFSRYTAAENSNTIWVTRQVDGLWTLPRHAEFTGRYYNAEAFVTRDNRTMYFVSIRDGGPDNFQLWTMDRTGAQWSAPRKLGQPFSTRQKMFPTVATNGNLYFTEFDNGPGLFFLARFRSGGFETPEPLSAVVNAFAWMGHAFVAPDESFLVFDAARHSNDNALYVSFMGGSDWLPPVRLGSDVNATATEICPALSPDGEYLLFSRSGDIYWVDAKVVLDLKPTS